MSDIINLNLFRAESSGDCRDWTVIDALNDSIQRVQRGEILPKGVYVAFYEPKHDRSFFPYSVAGLTRLEVIGILHQHAIILGAAGV